MQKYVFFLYLCKFNYQSIRKIMRLKTILFVLVACMVMEGCEKVDTDIFRRPFIVEGDFDPVWGIPAAKGGFDLDETDDIRVEYEQEAE